LFDGFPIPLIKLAFHELTLHRCQNSNNNIQFEAIYGHIHGQNDRRKLCQTEALLYDNEDKTCLFFFHGMGGLLPHSHQGDELCFHMNEPETTNDI